MEKKCNCGPECKCGPDCKCPPDCKGKCGPGMFGMPPHPPFPGFQMARVLEPAPAFQAQAWYDGMIQEIKLCDYKDNLL